MLLASIQGYLETIFMKKEDLDEERRQQFLDIIYQNTTMLNRLVGELFEFSKLDAKQSEPEIEPFSLAELVQDTVMEFRPQAEEHRIEIKAEYSQNLPLVRGDIGMIARVLTNLIENALHYTEQGTVTVLLADTPGSVETRVQDTGRGIPREDQPHIFDRICRVEKGRSSAPGGTGLGLAIAGCSGNDPMSAKNEPAGKLVTSSTTAGGHRGSASVPRILNSSVAGGA